MQLTTVLCTSEEQQATEAMRSLLRAGYPSLGMLRYSARSHKYRVMVPEVRLAEAQALLAEAAR